MIKQNFTTTRLAAALGLLFASACGTSTGGANTGTAGASSSATAGASGTAGVIAGSAGVSGGAGATGSAGAVGGAGATGSAGAVGSAGATGTAAASGTTGSAGATSDAGTTASGDTPAWRDMMPSDNMRHNVRFTPKMADPTNAMAMDGASHPADNQIAEVDATKPLKKKLCVVLPGIGNGPGQGIGDWAAGQGYHVFQVSYSNDLQMAPNGTTNPDEPGNTRMNQFDGKGRTPANANTQRFDSIEGRVIKGIQYLVTADPGADWGWYLNQDGTMRWSDGCFIGYSYGASHLAVIARYVRLGLGVSVSGPQAEGFPNATWLKTPSATPVERMWAMWGSQDEPAPTDNGYPSHYTTTTMTLGYIGEVVHTTVGGALGMPPLMGSHRISVDGQGHTEFCAGIPPLYCNLMFALPPYDK
ncbi:MAG TPA: hypothetical protein VH560_16320 [Polyangia bacterium]|nr:hypothetical protein [Polyangia bacterium]